MATKSRKLKAKWTLEQAPDLPMVIDQSLIDMLSNSVWSGSAVQPIIQKDKDTRGDILQDFLSPGVHAIMLIYDGRMIATPFIERANLMWMQHADGWLPVDRERVFEFIQDETATVINYALSAAEVIKIMAQPPQA